MADSAGVLASVITNGSVTVAVGVAFSLLRQRAALAWLYSPKERATEASAAGYGAFDAPSGATKPPSGEDGKGSDEEGGEGGGGGGGGRDGAADAAPATVELAPSEGAHGATTPSTSAGTPRPTFAEAEKLHAAARERRAALGLTSPSTSGAAPGSFEGAAPPRVGGGACAWLAAAWRATDEDIVAVAGLDALVYVAFLRLGLRVALLVSLYVLLVVLPCSVAGAQGQPGVERVAMSNVGAADAHLLWAHVSGVYVLSLVAARGLAALYASLAAWRVRFQARPEVQHFACVALDLPQVLTRGGDAALAGYFGALFPRSFAFARVVHVTTALDDAVQRRQQLQFALQRAQAVVDAGGDRPRHRTGCLGLCGPSVDSLEHARGELRALEADISARQRALRDDDERRAREATEAVGAAAPYEVHSSVGAAEGAVGGVVGVGGGGNVLEGALALGAGAHALRSLLVGSRGLAPAGVVAFDSLADRNLAAQSVLETTGAPWLVPCPEPRDLLWSNLAFTSAQRGVRAALSNAVMVATVLFYNIPIAFVSSLTTLSELAKVAPWLADLLHDAPALEAWLEGFLPTLALVVFMALLPTLTAALSAAEGVISRSDVQSGMANKLFLFNVVNVFLGSTVAGVIFSSFNSFASNLDPVSLARLLGGALPDVALFFSNYIMLLALASLPVELLRLGPLFMGVARRALGLYKTDAERARAEDPGPAPLGSLTPQALLVWLIMLVYAVLQPLVLVVAVFFFAIALVVWKHQLLFVYRVTWHAGGRMWPAMYTRAVVGLLVAQLTFIGVLPTYGASAQAAVLLPCPIITAWHAMRTARVMGRTFAFLPVAEARAADKAPGTGAAAHWPGPVASAEDRAAVVRAVATAFTEPSVTLRVDS